MKLTEKQLADIFSNSTKTNQTSAHVDDCLNALPASSTRLTHAEEMLNDYDSAQGMKMAFGLKQWSDSVAASVESVNKPWFAFLGLNSPLKTAVTTAAFAVTLVMVVPQINQQSTTVISPVQIDVVSDTINSIPFESNNDRLSKGGFDGNNDSKDNLFNASFG